MALEERLQFVQVRFEAETHDFASERNRLDETGFHSAATPCCMVAYYIVAYNASLLAEPCPQTKT